MLAPYAAHFDTPPGYLDFARFGPPSRDVVAATTKALELSARADSTAVDTLMEAEDAARRSAARLVGADAARTVLLPNASTGLFHAALGIREGVVLVPRSDFPANHYPWRRAAELGRATPRGLDPAPGSGVTPELVSAALTDDVVALSVSAVDFRTGFRADLAALREAVGADRLLIVDAIQALGVTTAAWDAPTWWSPGAEVAACRLVHRFRGPLRPCTGQAGARPHRLDGRLTPDSSTVRSTRPPPTHAAGPSRT